MNYTKEDLAGYDDAWLNSPQAPDNAPLPPGSYRVVVASAEIERPSWPGAELQLVLACEVVSGPYRGRKLWVRQSFAPDKIQYLRQTVARCGVDCERASDIAGQLGDFIGIHLEVTAKAWKTDKDKINVYVDRRVNGDAQPAPTDDELQF